jgi:type IV pilus assembly protein PilY1
MSKFNPWQSFRYLSLLLFICGSLTLSFCVGATDVQKSPLQTDGLAKPNVVFGMDDSGSMDTEVLLNTTDGGLWWNKTSKTAWVTTSGSTYGNPLAPSPTTSSDYNLIYLFPNGCGASGQRHLCDSSGYLAVPPIPQLASMRASGYNPLYYNPLLTYTPWPTATISGVSKTFTNASTTATPTHPLFPAVTMVLTTNQSSTAADYVFQGLPGMVLPIGTIVNATSTTSGACSGATMRTLTAAITLTTVTSCAISYYPATYWFVESCTVDGISCVTAPDGAKLHRYEIRSTVTTYPSGRTYAAELQNFANWFMYYRKRTLMVASSMGTVVGSLTGLRMGVVPFNASSTLTMYDTDATDPTINGQAVAGKFYGNLAASGTPTRTVLKAIGEMFRTAVSRAKRNRLLVD